MNIMTSIKPVVETLTYVKEFSGMRLLIKLGGSVLDNPELVKELCTDLNLVRAAGIRLVIVHGGGKAINNTLEKNGIKPEFRDGLRITNAAIIDTIETVLCGHINRMLVRTLNAAGIVATGMCGSDANLLQCKILAAEYGYVGEIENINTTLLEHVLTTQLQDDGGIIPVISPIGISRNGEALNVNADWAASRIAVALGIHKLIYLTDQNGIYDKNGTIIPLLDASELDELIHSGAVSDGMLTKAKTILNALNHGLDNIHIISGKNPHALIQELFTNQGSGTLCTKRTHTYSPTTAKNYAR